MTVINGGFSLHTLHCSSSSGPRGFLLHTVTRLLRPRLLSTNRGSATLCPLPALVLPLRFSFIAPSDDPWRQNSRASLGKAYDLPTYRPATHRFDMPDIGPRLFASARPSPRCHLAGSLFATYAVLPHTSSRPAISDDALVLLVSLFRPVTVSSFTSGGYTPENRS